MLTPHTDHDIARRWSEEHHARANRRISRRDQGLDRLGLPGGQFAISHVLIDDGHQCLANSAVYLIGTAGAKLGRQRGGEVPIERFAHGKPVLEWARLDLIGRRRRLFLRQGTVRAPPAATVIPSPNPAAPSAVRNPFRLTAYF